MRPRGEGRQRGDALHSWAQFLRGPEDTLLKHSQSCWETLGVFPPTPSPLSGSVLETCTPALSACPTHHYPQRPELSNRSEVVSGALGMSPSPPTEKRGFSTEDSGRGPGGQGLRALSRV